MHVTERRLKGERFITIRMTKQEATELYLAIDLEKYRHNVVVCDVDSALSRFTDQ